MDSFLDSLRQEALYIKLVADKKFGGAVDIEHLVKALHSINASYKNYVRATAKDLIGSKRITQSVAKEISKLVDESELLLVDLKFASFQGAITPNTVNVDHDFASIPQVLEVKKKSFRGYKKDVFNTDYARPAFQHRVLAKFSDEERASIYKPLFDNILTKKEIQMFFGDQLGKTTKQIHNVTQRTINILVPESKRKGRERENKLYVVYASTSGELDLFGDKPKLKYLAIEELDKPVYPYQAVKIDYDGSHIELNDTISAEVSFDEESNQFIITYPHLNITVWGDTREDAEEAFNFTFKALVESIYLEDNKNLTEDAIELKRKLRVLIKTLS